MKKLVVISGGFHPFHAGHMALYTAAKQAFPDAQIVIGATNAQKDRPFPFKIKQKLAQVSGVPPKDFVEVTRQFSGEDPAIASRIKNPNDTILIFARSEKDKGEAPLPAKPDPATGKLPLVTRGPNKGKPVSNYLQYLDGNEDNLKPMTQHAYMAYLPTIEFGPGITSASEFRELWNKLTKVLVNPKSTPEQKEKAKELKKELVMNMYPATQKNPKLAATVVKLLDAGMGVELEEGQTADMRAFFAGVDSDKFVPNVKQSIVPSEIKMLMSKLMSSGERGLTLDQLQKLKNYKQGQRLYSKKNVSVEEDLSRRGFLKGAGAMAAGASLGGMAKAADNTDPNRLIATVNIEGESKEFDLTGKFKGDARSQLHQAAKFLTNFLEDRDINFSNIELRYQGAVLRTQNTGSVNEKMKMGATIEPIEESNVTESLDYLEEK